MEQPEIITVDDKHEIEDILELHEEEKQVQSGLEHLDLNRSVGGSGAQGDGTLEVDCREASVCNAWEKEMLSTPPLPVSVECPQSPRSLISASELKEADQDDDASDSTEKVHNSREKILPETWPTEKKAIVLTNFAHISSVKLSCYASKSRSGASLPRATAQIEGREKRYPFFLGNRKSVNLSSSTSPNAWRTLQKSPSRKANPEETYPALEPQVLDMMKELDECRKKCETEANYIEANAAAARLHELKNFEDNKRRVVMLERHMSEVERANKAFKVELDERNELWDEQSKSFHKEVMEHAARLKREHAAVIQNFRSTMASKTPSKPQWSRELLKLRKVQACLGKQGKYLEAQNIKQYTDRMEQQELQETIHAYQNEVAVKEQSLRAKQQTELEVLLQRAAQARDELRKSRAKDLELCELRNVNIVRELKAMHTQECIRFDQLLGKK